ncbi:MAG: thioredoxin [Cyanobacteria bacterium HKST-UBA04]|nr:thioredoxin [Cyanobacteria bacterium HKST-UBA04]
MGSVLEVTDNTFEEEVKRSDSPVLVDFWAPWCGPCKTIAPIVEELASDYSGKLKVVKINTDDNFKTAQEYRISGIPSLLIFKNGEPVEQMVGVHKKSTLADMINKHLSSN